MANDTLKTALPDTFNLDWLNTEDDKVLTALDSITGDTADTDINTALNAIKQLPSSFGLGRDNFGLGETFTETNAGDEGFTMPEVSKETVDKFTPLIGIGVGELLTRGRDYRPPAGFKPAVRAGGAKGLSFLLATKAQRFGNDFAEEYLDMKEGPAAVVGGAAAYGAWKGAPWLAKTIMSDIKIGMASQVMDGMALEAGKSAFSRVLKKGAAMGAARKNSIAAADKFANKAMKEMSEKTMQALKERMGKTASEGFDDVTKRLMNPRVTARVGKFLVNFAPKLGAKLALSSTAMAVPEPVSTVLGGIGMAFTFWDIFNLSKKIPALQALIFDDTPEESIENKVIDEMTVSDSLFTPDEQRAIP